MPRFSLLYAPAISVVSVLALISCGGREFRTQRDVISHFESHRQDFERAVALFVGLNIPTIKIPDRPGAEPEGPLVELARELRVSSISAVPGAAPADEQWIEFTLAARYMMSTYGVIFVPESHGAALSAVTSYVRSPPQAIRLVRPIEARWFYYEYN